MTPLEQAEAWPPMAQIEGDQIVIRIAISAIPVAASVAFVEADFDVDEDTGESELKVTDAKTFANEMIRELIAEEEDGTTLIHKMLDTAMINAAENGAEGLSE